jgi:hypothetical protein
MATDEKINSMIQLHHAAPVLFTLAELAKNHTTVELLTSDIDPEMIDDYQCTIRFTKPMFLHLLKTVEKQVKILNNASNGFFGGVLLDHDNGEVLSRLIGTILQLGLIDLVENSEKHINQLKKNLEEMGEKIIIDNNCK